MISMPTAPVTGPRRPALSPRELEVVDLMSRPGAKQATVAEALGISVNTVESHLRSVYRKLDVNTAGQAWRALNGQLDRPNGITAFRE